MSPSIDSKYSVLINIFINIVHENNIKFATKKVLAIIAFLHFFVHGFLPKKFEYLLSRFGINNFNQDSSPSKIIEIPYHYKISTILCSLLEKLREEKCAKSIGKQLWSMLNPKTMLFVNKIFVERRKRTTY